MCRSMTLLFNLFTPGEWRRNHGDYLVQGSFMNVIQPECFTLQGPDVSKASIISKKDAEKGNNFLLNRIKAHHAARMATLGGAKTTKKNFLCLNIAITRGIIIRKSLSTLLSVLGTLPRFGETMYDTLSRADGGLLAARDLGAYSCPCSCHFALICSTPRTTFFEEFQKFTKLPPSCPSFYF